MPSLVLHAGDPDWSPQDPGQLIQAMHELDLISNPCDAERNNNTYWAGDAFLSLMMFLGCSPRVQLNPQSAADGQSVCSIRFLTYADVTFLAAAKRPAPRCPHCRTAVSDSENINRETTLECAHCRETLVATELDWRQAAGYGRCFVDIAGIYPHEAVPSDKLLTALSDCSGGGWVYFYQ